jgi:Tfp pilus assembly PilM family ATPase
MFGNWFNSKGPTIGIDVGRSAIKLAQVGDDDGAPRLVASASIEVPPAQRATSAGPLEVFQQTIDDVLASNDFRGRRVIIGLPATYVHIDRLRLSPMLSEDELRQAVTWESADKLPFHPSRGMLRHLVAGVVYEHDEQRNEVILLAVRQDVTDRLLAAAAKAKLDVVGLRPEPMALAEVFGRADAERNRAVVDIGHGSTRLYVMRGAKLEFARSIGIGRQHIGTRAEDAQAASRIAQRDADVQPRDTTPTTAVLAPSARAAAVATPNSNAEPLRRLVRELSLSLHYHEETFPGSPVKELAFVGGTSLQRRTCQQIAAGVGINSRAADLLALSPDAPARPDLAVAISLSLATPDGNK